MSKSIRLHPKYGLNPTMEVCFWCQKETGSILMLGAAYKGEAPRRMSTGYTPCKECAALFAAGIQLVEVTDTEPHTLTGRYVVVTRDTVPDIIKDPDTLSRVLKIGRAAVSQETMNMLIAAAEVEGVTAKRSTVDGTGTVQ